MTPADDATVTPSEHHPDGCGACDPETACGDCAVAYALQDAAEADAAMFADAATYADTMTEEQNP